MHKKTGMRTSGVFSKEKDKARERLSFLGRQSWGADKQTGRTLITLGRLYILLSDARIFSVQFQYQVTTTVISVVNSLWIPRGKLSSPT